MTTANNELLHFFFEDVSDTMAGIDERLHNLRGAQSYEDAEPQMEALGVLTHRLRGTAGLYGFPQMAQLASVAERLLMPRPRLNPELQGTYTEVLDGIVGALRGAIGQAQTSGREGNLGLTFAQSSAAQKMSELLRTQPGAFHLARGHLRGQVEDLETDEQDADASAAQASLAAPTEVHGAAQAASDQLSRQLQDFARDNAEVWEYFAPEVQEHLDALQLGLGAAEPDLAALFRSAHTIKGSAYMVGLQPLGDFAHRMEDLLGAVRDGRQELEGPAADTLELASDLIAQMLQVAGGQSAALDEPADRLGTRLQLLAGGHDWTEVVARETQRAAAQQTAQAPLQPRAEAAEALSEPQSTLEHELAAFGRDNAEVMEYFAPEVQEHVEALRAQLERGAEADINELFRSAHTVKGSSYMV
ncbi:MAG: Hpt domain-containing protein, partial [Deinococcus sp.]|nr:Hpt domain-containing protein [Deinococcus sp.]